MTLWAIKEESEVAQKLMEKKIISVPVVEVTGEIPNPRTLF